MYNINGGNNGVGAFESVFEGYQNPNEPTTRPRRASDPLSSGTYVSAYPPSQTGYRVTFADGASSNSMNGKASEFVSTRLSMGLRAVLNSTMMGIKTKCEEVSRFATDVSKGFARGGNEDAIRQFIDNYADLVAAIFGLPRDGANATESVLGMSSSSSSSLSPGWLQSATTVEEFEGLYQLLQPKGALVSMMQQLPLVANVPLYAFPTAALPAEVQQAIVSSDYNRMSLLGHSPESSIVASRINRANQPGLTLPIWEYWLFAFAWFATQGETDEAKNVARTDGSHHRTMVNALYTSVLRQYALALLEAEASSSAQDTGGRGMGASGGMGGGAMGLRGGAGGGGMGVSAPPQLEGPFRSFVATLCEFWMHQNSPQLFTAISASYAHGDSGGPAASAAFVLRSKYRAPTYLILNGLHDVLTLVLHVASDVAAVRFAESVSRRGGAMEYGGVHAAADRIASAVLRDQLLDPLYRTLKLGLLLAPPMWPYLVSLWRLVTAPWLQRATAEARHALSLVHERKQAQANSIPLAYSTGQQSQQQQQQQEQRAAEEFPFSTLVVSPFEPASLRSPFVLSKVAATTGASAAANLMQSASLFGLSSLFSASGTSTSLSPSPLSTSTLPITIPQNWMWFSFFDPTKPIGAWSGAATVVAAAAASNPSAASIVADVPIDYRGYVTFDFALYTPLFRSWLGVAHELYVLQAQPLSSLFLVALHAAALHLNAPPLGDMLRELENIASQPYDRFAPGGRLATGEMEKRIMQDRWTHLEHGALPTTGASAQRVCVGLLRECHRYVRLASSSGWSLWKGLGASSGSTNDDATRLRRCVDEASRDALALLFVPLADLQTHLERDMTEDAKLVEQRQQQHAQQVQQHQRGGEQRLRALTDEQRAMLRHGMLRMDHSTSIPFEGDPWLRPVSSHESAILLWVLYRLSLLFGLVDPRLQKTHLNLRPLGRKLVLWVVLGLWLLTLLGRIDMSFLFAADDE